MVTEGVVKRNNPIRVLRDNVVIFEGELESPVALKMTLLKSVMVWNVVSALKTTMT